ncbi:hypothetical protein HDV05_001318 [Chytridiales sp. JEL 0842]|nr:hypothetical protein HDV05_001318 [Chytridiales sp. JEL 0842]
MDDRTQEGTFLTSDRLTIAYKSYGSPATAKDCETRAFIAVHGWLDNANSFDLIAPQLSRDLACYIVCIDLTGHGRSDTLPRGSQFYHWDFAAVILDLLEHFKWPICNLISHSMGGHISYMFAGAFPDRVKKLVVIESIGHINRFEDDSQALAGYLTKRRLANLFENKAEMEGTLGPHSGKAIYPSAEDAAKARMQGVTTVSFAAAMLLCERGLVKVESNQGCGYTWTTDKRLFIRNFIRWDHQGFSNIMRAITCDILLIIGNESTLLGTDARTRHPIINERLECLRTRKVGKTEIRKLPGGHHPHLESETVGAALTAILEFLGCENVDGRESLVEDYNAN